jgi:cell division protein FtsB
MLARANEEHRNCGVTEGIKQQCADLTQTVEQKDDKLRELKKQITTMEREIT